jgi:glycosyltransferase involved in cell wall biosynthesis
MNIGILVVAYNAESTIIQTLSRIPKSFSDRITAILVSDDSSIDSTFRAVNDFASTSDTSITSVYQVRNLGYGGNQKFGYAWALSNNWDLVVLLHADGQYAPEFLEKIVEPIVLGDADVVLGSRMINKRAALEGGMPYYKWIGNQILTKVQNMLTGQSFAEWHTGYRAYRVSTLDNIPFKQLNNGFRFDTQIILELIKIKARFNEIPIPTFYGDEISHVNGLKYAREIIWDTIRHRVKNGVSKESNIDK